MTHKLPLRNSLIFYALATRPPSARAQKIRERKELKDKELKDKEQEEKEEKEEVTTKPIVETKNKRTNPNPNQ